MGQLAATIEKLQRVKSSVLNVRPFYITHLPRWHERARLITAAVLENTRPPDADPIAWGRRVATESARVNSLLDFGQDDAGAIISLGIAPAGVPADDPRNFSSDGLSINDISRWVEAGRSQTDPDVEGKRLDERDAGKSDLQIAWRVMWALKLRKPGWERLLAHVAEFAGQEETSVVTGYYADILQAWSEQLGPEIRAAFRAWVHTQVTQALSK